MNVFSLVAAEISAAIATLVEQGVFAASPDLSRLAIEPPRDASHGDVACNAAMVLCKEAGLKPRDLADKLIGVLAGSKLLVKAEIAGPGFINLSLRPSIWGEVLARVLADPQAHARADVGKGVMVNIEYVSANPTGPMHVGHCRGAVFGDALANLMAAAGFDVTREYYINDAGAQVDVLARSAFLRYREALGEEIGDIPEGLYPGSYLVPVGQALAAEHGRDLLELSERGWLPIIRAKAIEMMMEAIKGDLAALNIKHDVFFSERSLIAGATDRVGATIEALRAAGHIYDGRLPPPKGAPVEDWEDREQTLFRATKFGDDVDRPLQKSDGGYTYFASDIAYHADKFARGFTHMIDVWGADHGGYITRMKAAVAAVTGGSGALDVEIIQLVRLMRNGEPVKMSKRAGEFITLRDVVDEVGRDAVRFMMLYRKNDAPLDFDLAKVVEQSRDNPVFYVQYAHARAHSVLRNGIAALGEEAVSAAALMKADVSGLVDEGEIQILKRIAQMPRLIEQAGTHREPHRVAFYLYELASEFHGQWNRGKDLPHLRFIMENDRQISLARLALVRGVVDVLARGLEMLGVEAPTEMR